jgi:hypothetical protein
MKTPINSDGALTVVEPLKKRGSKRPYVVKMSREEYIDFAMRRMGFTLEKMSQQMNVSKARVFSWKRGLPVSNADEMDALFNAQCEATYVVNNSLEVFETA